MRLKSFSVSNYRSFKNTQTISFSNNDKNTTAIYGPNGAGKSNLFRALLFFRDFIRTSTQFNGYGIYQETFLLNIASKTQPTTLEAELETDNGEIFHYGFSLLSGNVIDEFLRMKKYKNSYETIFRRNSINKENRYEANGFTSDLLKRTRPDALILTKAWEDNNKYAKAIFQWLDNFNLINCEQPVAITAQHAMEDPAFKQRVLDLLRSADMFIQDLEVSVGEVPQQIIDELPLAKDFKAKMNKRNYGVSTIHLVRDTDGDIAGIRRFDLGQNESVGTQKFFGMAYPLLDTIDNGKILYIDDFDNNLHPVECQLLVKLFSSSNNPKNAQLIINTHCTGLQDQLGKENIRFVSKNSNEESSISLLPNFIRNDDKSIERKYNKGLLGAIPKVGL